MEKLVALLFLFLLTITTSAQVKLSGHVTDLNSRPVTDVIVKLTSGRRTIAYTTTDAKGNYYITVEEKTSREMMLSFNHIGYERETKAVTADGKEQRRDISLTPKDITLKEVTVKPNPLWQRGDTLNHNLAQFLGKGDVTLEDGLKRLPGVEVGSSGGISYMGRPISQFNIEGMDLLGGKYNLATRNIPTDYVTDVQIVRNHHGRKVEKDKPSNEVSMNIKLAKKAKFKPLGQEETGAGCMEDGNDRFQGLLGLTGMLFTNSFQTIGSVKAGNYKNFGASDMVNHFGGSGISTSATSLFRGFDGGAPPRGEYRYRRNGMASLNAIQKLDSATTTLRVNADYSYRRATHDISIQSTYLSNDGQTVTVSESSSPLTKIHQPSLEVNYLRNADTGYLNERLSLVGQFEHNEGNVRVNGNEAEQHRRTSSFQIANNLYWSQRSRKGTLRHADASVKFTRTPTLRMSFVNDGQSYGQTAQSSTLTMSTGTSVKVPLSKTFSINLPIGIDATYNTLETFRSLTSEANSVSGWELSPAIRPGFQVQSRNKRFFLGISVPLLLRGFYYDRLNYTKLFAQPSANIILTFNANSKLEMNSSYQTQVDDMMTITTLLTDPIQTDYRSVHTASGIIGKVNYWSSNAEWCFEQPMSYFTLRLAASYNWQKRNTLSTQSLSGIDISASSLLRDTHSRYTSFSLSSTKNIPTLYAKFGVDGNYGFGQGEQAVGESIIKTRSNSFNAHGKANLSPLQWIELGYNIRYGWVRSRYADESHITTSLTHSGALHVFPVAVVDLSLDYDFVRQQLAPHRYKRMSLFNASAQWKMKRVVLRLELTNLTDEHHYAYTVFDGINTYIYDYGLCGRTVLLHTTMRL